MRLKVKNIVRGRKQSFIFFSVVLFLMVGSLVYLFVSNQLKYREMMNNRMRLEKFNSEDNNDDENDGNDDGNDDENGESDEEGYTHKKNDKYKYEQQSQSYKQKQRPLSTPIKNANFIKRNKNVISTKAPFKQSLPLPIPVPTTSSYIKKVPKSSNAMNPAGDVDPWSFISYLPTEETRLNSLNRDKPNDYFLEGISITREYSGNLNKPIEEPYETEHFRGGENFTYI